MDEGIGDFSSILVQSTSQCFDGTNGQRIQMGQIGGGKNQVPS